MITATLEERLKESEDTFNKIQATRNEHLKAAEDCLVELNKLQGEYRLLQELMESDESKSPEEADTIEAVPEGLTE